jgi:hypothetical protein
MCSSPRRNHGPIPWLFLRPEQKPCGRRSLAAAALSSRNDTKRPATAAPTNGVPAKTICHSTPAFLRAVSYNRNRSTPRARSRFRDDNCAANARLSPTRDQNIFPNRDALPQAGGHKSKFLPNGPRPWHPRAPSACRTNTRRRRLTRGPGCDPRLPWPTRPHIRISPGLSPNNALQNLHAARAPVIPSAVEESLAT